MKSLLPFFTLLFVLASCTTAYKTAQTPDDGRCRRAADSRRGAQVDADPANRRPAAEGSEARRGQHGRPGRAGHRDPCAPAQDRVKRT